MEHNFIIKQINILPSLATALRSAPSEIGSSLSSTIICPIFSVKVPVACLNMKKNDTGECRTANSSESGADWFVGQDECGIWRWWKTRGCGLFSDVARVQSSVWCRGRLETLMPLPLP